MMMNTATPKKADSRFPRYQGILEVLLFVIVTPALVYSVLAMDNVPPLV